MDRDMKAKPYTPEEKRVAEYMTKVTRGAVGTGMDPIGFLLASHAWLRHMHTFEPGDPKSVRARMDNTAYSGEIGKRDMALIWYYGAPGYVLSAGPELDDEPSPEFAALMLAIIQRADDPAWRKEMLDWADKQPKKKP